MWVAAEACCWERCRHRSRGRYGGVCPLAVGGSVIFWPSVVIITVPVSSVLNRLILRRFSLSNVLGWGCLYELPLPHDITAAFGVTASKNAAVVEVRLPWWPAFNTSDRRGCWLFSISRSDAFSASPVNRKEVSPCSMRTTADISFRFLNFCVGAITINWIIPAARVSPTFGIVIFRFFFFIVAKRFLKILEEYTVSIITTLFTSNCLITIERPPMWSVWGCVAIT